MKLSTIKRLSLLVGLLLGVALPSKAQLFQNTYMNIDWQINIPLGSDFADKGSGWGANFEGGYFLTDNITIGGFISYSTNIEDIGRETLTISSSESITTSQKHTMFQLPFGASMRYYWGQSDIFTPYAGVKLGAQYMELASYYYLLKNSTDSWGFTLSPEVGLNIYPRSLDKLGFHVAMYYSYATNKSTLLTYEVKGVSNLGFRVGVSF